MKIRTTLITIIVVLMTMGYTTLAFGAISEEEINKLGGAVLTPMGAERAGNKDGSIPAWTGVPIPVPKGFKPGSGVYVDPFADEKPLFSINQKNMNQYADKLAEGVKSLMKRHPDYRIDVYPTHRTMVFPQWYYDQTKKSATKCQVTNKGRTLIGCWGGCPFPIPRNGDELIWNHLTRFLAPESWSCHLESYNVTPAGKVALSLQALFTYDQLWNNPKNENDWRVMLFNGKYLGPPRRNGEAVLITYPTDFVKRGQVTWQYLPGQRRVRLAPDICCDTPNAGTAGASVYDETMVFMGDPDRFNWRLVGKKEMYIPYNTYKFVYYRGPVEKGLLAHFINPDLVRYELHRVWVLEATLKPDKRHIYSKRVMYIDEDSFGGLMSDNYDLRGQLYRMTTTHSTYSYDVHAEFKDFLSFYDVISNSYAVNMWPRLPGGVQYMKFHPESFNSPDSMAGGGLR